MERGEGCGGEMGGQAKAEEKRNVLTIWLKTVVLILKIALQNLLWHTAEPPILSSNSKTFNKMFCSITMLCFHNYNCYACFPLKTSHTVLYFKFSIFNV